VFRPLEAWRWRVGSDEGFRMSPGRCWLVVVIGVIVLPRPDILLLCILLYLGWIVDFY